MFGVNLSGGMLFLLLLHIVRNGCMVASNVGDRMSLVLSLPVAASRTEKPQLNQRQVNQFIISLIYYPIVV